MSNLIINPYRFGSAASSTILDIEYPDATTGTHDLATGDLVLPYDSEDKPYRITPRSNVDVDIDLWGGGGGWGQNVTSSAAAAGAGAKVSVTGYALTGGTEYLAVVGEGGQRGSSNSLAGGWPDGGDHTAATAFGYVRGTGGGSSRFAVTSDVTNSGNTTADLNNASSDYLAIAAAGGGAGAGVAPAANAGAGGADTGADGNDYSGVDFGGHGGTQSAGGTGSSGRTGTGGSGGKYAGGDGQTASDASSGTGGGGYYGGGAGGGYYAPGGGGSSYLDSGVSGTKTAGADDVAPSGQPASYPNAGDAKSLDVGYNGVVVMSLAS